MKTLTNAELIDWCASQEIEIGSQRSPILRKDGLHCARFTFPKSINRLMWFCRFVDSKLQPRNTCVLWVTDWRVWPSSENLHLYYKLRQSYSDFGLLEDAPGHLFHEFEIPDFLSFLYIGVVSGWDMYVFPTEGYGRAFISHDGWIEFAMSDAKELEDIAAEVSKSA